MSYANYVEKLANGETVQFRPRGNSMQPKIKSGELVTVTPMKDATENTISVETGDVVFCKVAGSFYVHLVKSVKDGSYLIGNNHGKINGWTKNVYGKVTAIEP